jgi:hypothetical protein
VPALSANTLNQIYYILINKNILEYYSYIRCSLAADKKVTNYSTYYRIANKHEKDHREAASQ